MVHLDDIDNLALLRLYHLDTGPIARFRRLLSGALEEAVKELPGVDQPWEEGEDIVREELGLVDDLGNAVLLVALFQHLEARVRECLNEAGPGEPANTEPGCEQCERMKSGESCDECGLPLPAEERLYTRIRNCLGELETLDGFEAFDELRLAVNAWKHNDGVVNRPLAKRSPERWGKRGDWMTGAHMAKAYDALLPGIRTFAHSLYVRLDKLRHERRAAKQSAAHAASGS